VVTKIDELFQTGDLQTAMPIIFFNHLYWIMYWNNYTVYNPH